MYNDNDNDDKKNARNNHQSKKFVNNGKTRYSCQYADK